MANVSKAFGPTHALRDVSLTVARGESRALIGKNGAGKSTLMSILTGLTRPDSGSIMVLGSDDGDDRSKIGCVYQRSTLIPAATAAENISLGNFPRGAFGLIKWPDVKERSAHLLEEWGCGHVSNTPVEQLEPLERKIVEICRVLSMGPQVLLLDEPTAGLDLGGTKRLFDHIQAARQRGVSIIYVSHHLQEIFEVCDSVTVLRDGAGVMSGNLSGLVLPDLVEAMLGEQLEDEYAQGVLSHVWQAHDGDDEPTLIVEGLYVAPNVVDFNLRLLPGECVGITGLDGSGMMQVAEALTGHKTPTRGSITLNGKKLPYGDIGNCIKAGVGFTPEDRHLSGYVPALSVSENSTLSILWRFANRVRLVKGKQRDGFYTSLATEWGIKAWGPGQPTEELSGGNQQKVVLARSVAGDPKVLVLINPTAGVDVGAKRSIYETIRDLSKRGVAVILVTSDDGDLEFCERVLAMFHGVVVEEMFPPFTEQEIAAAVQGAKSAA